MQHVISQSNIIEDQAFRFQLWPHTLQMMLSHVIMKKPKIDVSFKDFNFSFSKPEIKTINSCKKMFYYKNMLHALYD